MATKIVNVRFKDIEKEVKVGDSVFITNVNDRRYNAPPAEYKIDKIGAKLIHLKHSTHVNFDGLSFYFDGSERSDYSHNTIWSSLEGRIENIAKNKLVNKIQTMGTYQLNRLSMNAITAFIDEVDKANKEL